jgi:hypothetical protein
LLFSARLFDDDAFVLIAVLSILVQGEATARESIRTPSMRGKEKVWVSLWVNMLGVCTALIKNHLDLDRKEM